MHIHIYTHIMTYHIHVIGTMVEIDLMKDEQDEMVTLQWIDLEDTTTIPNMSYLLFLYWLIAIAIV